MAKFAEVKVRSVKVKHILYGFWFFVVLITLRLFYLQVENGLLFASLGEKNFLRMEIITPLRGDVYDSKNVLLAANRPIFDLYWQGVGQRTLSDADVHVIKKIGLIVGVDFSDDVMKSRFEYAAKHARRIVIKEDLSYEQLCQISEQCSEAQHLVITNRFKRVYPYESLAAHVLGYLNRTDNTGKCGIEQYLEGELQGKVGFATHVINSTGKKLAQTMYKHATAGADISLTIDSDIQKMAEGLFEQDQTGAFILMDPENGAIRSLVSHPGFDPNVFLRPISEQEWDTLSVNNPLLNRATNALYPPASTFKLVTLAAALEEKIIDQHATLNYCPGYTEFCGRRYYCINHTGHGNLTVKNSLAMSCNILCFSIARKIRIDKLSAYANKFGLGQKTDFILPEKAGLMPTSAWKRALFGQRWWAGETLSACIGQSYLLVTPLQVARMVSSICSGYLVKPRMLENESVEKKPLEISRETLQFLRNGMREAVASGSARALANLKMFEINAKTGTAQTCALDLEKVHKHHWEHGWFVCYFSYKGKKPLTMVVLIENAGSSRVAIAYAEKFFRKYQTLVDLEHKEN